MKIMINIKSLSIFPFSIVIIFILIISIKCLPIKNNKFLKGHSSFSLKHNNKKEQFVFMNIAKCFV